MMLLNKCYAVAKAMAAVGTLWLSLSTPAVAADPPKLQVVKVERAYSWSAEAGSADPMTE